MPKLTRRRFLTLATAGAGLALIENTLSPMTLADELIKGGKSVSRTTGLPRRAVPGTCLMCPARCGILAYVEENSVVKLEGNPRDPNSRGRLCAKGQAGLNVVYNPDRLLYPIRRKGPRGSGSWIRITWDEALDELGARLKSLQASGHQSDLAFLGGILEGTGGLAGRFLRAYGTNKVFDEAALYTANKTAAQRMTWGADLEVPQLARTFYILNFGANPCESHPLFVPLAQRIVDAQMNGAKLVTLDPRMSATAARSAEWLPIKPGSDAVVALAMANVIVQRGLYDANFVAKWINYSFTDLARHLAQFTPALAEEASGIPGSIITRIAVEFASTKPATTISGGGVSQHANGTTAERAVALLNALTGNVDVNGGYCLPRRHTLLEPSPAPEAPTAPQCAACANIPAFFQAVQRGEERASVLISNMANPVFNAPDGERIAAVLKDETLVPYHVAFDAFLTETAVLADIVLPAATYLERWDVQSMPAFEMVPYVSIMQPAIKPLGESLSFQEACLTLAKQLGGDVAGYFPFGSMADYVAGAVGNISGLAAAGGLDYLKRYGLWFDPNAKPAERSYESAGFATPSKKFEVYVAALEGQGLSLPTAPVGQRAAAKELTLITFQFPVHTYGLTANSMLLSEIVHDNPVWIHPERAAALGIKRGDLVEVHSEQGTIQTKAWVTQAIAPDALAIGMGVGHWASSRIARAQRFKSEEPNTEHVWWAKHGNGSHPYPLIPVSADPVAGGPAWVATRVTVSKAAEAKANESKA